MARRFTYSEKGKGIAEPEPTNPGVCIRAPRLDTSELVRKNALTLIGRLTNPREQRLRSMLPYFSNKWELRGLARGSELGNRCFQFRFDYEDDLKKVLDNRPYQYSRWMEIGELISFEITEEAAKIKVEIDGLKPLTKEATVDFEDGSEAQVTLDYHKLDKHCSHCFKLTHEVEQCPTAPRRHHPRNPERIPTNEQANHLKPPYFTTPNPRSPTLNRRREEDSNGEFTSRKLGREDIIPDHHARRGNRKSPPLSSARRPYPPPNSTRTREVARSYQSHSVRSPPFWQRNQTHYPRRQSPNQIWQEKSNQRGENSEDNFAAQPRHRTPISRNLDRNDFPITPVRNQTEEEILHDLQEVDVRYVNCGDPIESAARRQRVLESEVFGMREETAAYLYNAPSNQPHQSQNPSESPPTDPLQNLTSTRRQLESQEIPATLPEEPERELILGHQKKRRGRPPTKATTSKRNQQTSSAGPSKRKTKTQMKSPLLRISPFSRVIHNISTLQLQIQTQNQARGEVTDHPNQRQQRVEGRNGGEQSRLSEGLPPRARNVPVKLKDGADFHDPQNPLP
ncbi:unnamed protein product [Microthlaspi erraticum]|uniref:DUF4283 domain-containing protein n=1 Tax=Microthlaspi erraticum TaxID=1685480 RepID=A0A6D2JUN9_9BRAS|nr:unnamed protein product [Microthlaspi erraticum]